MQGMGVETVDGEPYERNLQYEAFFKGHDPSRKRLLIMTYDTLLRDCGESVVRDREKKPPAEVKKLLAEARKVHSGLKTAFDAKRKLFEAHFGDRTFDTHEYVRRCLEPADSDAPRPVRPAGWSDKDTEVLDGIVLARDGVKAAADRVSMAKDAAEPPRLVPGLLKYVQELLEVRPGVKLMFVMDEMHVLKNHKGKIHGVAADVAKVCTRVVGMTATPVKNRLMEFFSLFRIAVPGLFPKITHFQNAFCVTKMQRISGGRQVPIVVGYKNLDQFVVQAEPYYLSRRKHDVAKELPQLVTQELVCELTDQQEELYDMAEAGLLTKGSDPDAANADVLSAMVMVQQAADSPELLKDQDDEPIVGRSSKIDTLIEMMEDNLAGVKTIVFSRFERMISLVEEELKKNKIRCVRITGKETKASDREKSKALFQDMKSGVDVILITTAGSESINLQAAEHIVFLNSPWSWGDYAQLTGRAIRIGSVHTMVVATHLVAAKRGGGKTIDHYVIKKLRSKKALADKVAGESVKDGLKFVESDDAMDIFRMIKESRGEEAGVSREALQSKVAGMVKSASKKPASLKKSKKPDPEPHHPAVASPEIDLSDL
jgi:superfamily II DNA or RNA helicase